MQKISLDFQQTSYLSRRLIWRRVGVLLLVVSLIINMFLLIKNQDMTTEADALLIESDIDRNPAQVIQVAESDASTDVADAKLREANIVLSNLNLPWPLLLKTLEDTREEDIDIIAVTPNTVDGDVQIVGQAENLKSLFDYMSRLKKSQMFSTVSLIDHQKVSLHQAHGLRFNIVAQWLINHE